MRISVRATLGALVASALLAGGAGTAHASGVTAPNPVLAMSFDELQGSKVNDSSPANNDGMITGAQWRQDGRFGGALAFDGDDRVIVPDAASLDLTTAATMSAWVRPRTQERWQGVVHKNSGSSTAYGLYGTTTDKRSTFTAWSGGDGIYGYDPLPMEAWSHIAATYDGTYWRLYLDGELVNTQAARPFTITKDELHIGNTADRNEGFDGLIDEVRVYGAALTEDQIARDRDTRVKSDTEEPVAPVLAMSFDENAGAIVNDSSTYGNSGVIRGATWTTSGKNDGGLSFDGLDDWVTVQDSASLDLTTQMTVSSWVKIRRNKSWHTIVTKEMGTGDMSYQLYASAWASTDGPITQLAKTPPDGTYRNAYSSTALQINRWYHVAYTYDGVTIRLYLDGTQIASSASTGPVPVTNEPLRIGGNLPWHPGEYLDGVLDDLRVYNKALTIGQVQADKAAAVRSTSASPPEQQAEEAAAAAPVAESAVAPAPALAALPQTVPAPNRAATKRAVAKKKPRCRLVKRRVALTVGGKRKTVVRKVCAKPKKPVRRTAKRRSASGGR